MHCSKKKQKYDKELIKRGEKELVGRQPTNLKERRNKGRWFNFLQNKTDYITILRMDLIVPK